MQAVAPSLGVEVIPVDMRNAAEIEQSVESFARFPNGGLIPASSAAAPEKPGAGGGDRARSLPAPTGVTEALALLVALAPPWLCGSAMPVSSTLFLAKLSLARASGFRPGAP